MNDKNNNKRPVIVRPQHRIFNEELLRQTPFPDYLTRDDLRTLLNTSRSVQETFTKCQDNILPGIREQDRRAAIGALNRLINEDIRSLVIKGVEKSLRLDEHIRIDLVIFVHGDTHLLLRDEYRVMTKSSLFSEKYALVVGFFNRLCSQLARYANYSAHNRRPNWQFTCEKGLEIGNTGMQSSSLEIRIYLPPYNEKNDEEPMPVQTFTIDEHTLLNLSTDRGTYDDMEYGRTVRGYKLELVHVHPIHDETEFTDEEVLHMVNHFVLGIENTLFPAILKIENRRREARELETQATVASALNV